MRLEFHPEAEQEFVEAVARYEAEVAGVGERFDAEMRAACAVLVDYPDIGVPIDPDLRKLVLDRFPYSLIYGRIRDTIYIVAVAHERRPPRYWDDRNPG